MAEISWIKINVDMFNNRKIKQIRKLPSGDSLALFWVMLLTLAGKCNSNGFIFFTEKIPYTPEMLSSELDIELNTVKLGLEIFKKFEMLEIEEDTLFVAGWSQHQNIEGMERVKALNRERKRKERERKKNENLLAKPQEKEPCHEGGRMTSRDSHAIDKEVEVDIDKEVEVDIDKEREVEVVDKENTAATTTNLIQFLEKNFMRPLSPIEIEGLLSYLNDGVGEEVIKLAIIEAVESGVRTIKYLKKILNTWLDKGLLTAEQVKANKKEFELKKDGRCENGRNNLNDNKGSSGIYDFSQYGG